MNLRDALMVEVAALVAMGEEFQAAWLPNAALIAATAAAVRLQAVRALDAMEASMARLKETT